jgi:nucleotide-binding universal stress UspA family protein
MSTFPTKILLATDGSEEAELAANTALSLIQKTGSELHVVHVLPWPLDTDVPSSFDPEVRRRLERGAHNTLNELVGRIEASGGKVEGSHLGVGRPDAEIIDRAEEIGAGLILVGSRGFGAIRRALTGSVSDSVVRHAHCPVMVVRWRPVVFPTKVLLATDGSEEAQLAARSAIELAKNKDDSELHLIYVVHRAEELRQPEGLGFGSVVSQEELKRIGEARLDKLVKQIEDAGGSVGQAHLRQGRTDEKIVTQAEEIGAGLIVVGSRGLGGVRRALMGSVSDSVVRHAHCPVMVVRPEKERSTEHEADSLT